MKNPTIPQTMIKPFVAPVTGLLSYFALTMAAFSGPVFDVDFSGDTIGSSPATILSTPSGQTVANPNLMSTPAAFSVAENYQSGEATLAGRSVVFRVNKSEGSPAAGGSLTFWGNVDDFVESEDYSIKADLLFKDTLI